MNSTAAEVASSTLGPGPNPLSLLGTTDLGVTLLPTSDAQTTTTATAMTMSAVTPMVATTDSTVNLTNQVAMTHMVKAILNGEDPATPLPQNRMSPKMQEQAYAAAVATINTLAMPINPMANSQNIPSYTFPPNTTKLSSTTTVSLSNTIPSSQTTVNSGTNPVVVTTQSMLLSNAAFAVAAGVNPHEASISPSIETINTMLTSPTDILNLSTDVMGSLPSNVSTMNTTTLSQTTQDAVSSSAPITLSQRQWSDSNIYGTHIQPSTINNRNWPITSSTPSSSIQTMPVTLSQPTSNTAAHMPSNVLFQQVSQSAQNTISQISMGDAATRSTSPGTCNTVASFQVITPKLMKEASLSGDESTPTPGDTVELSYPYTVARSHMERSDAEAISTGRCTCRWYNCYDVFESLGELIQHVGQIHIGSGKPGYSCQWEGCTRGDRPFTKRHKMHNHLRTHTGERPYQCTIDNCGKRFSRPDSLATHIKTHSNVRPYHCRYSQCGKSYYHSRSLRKHERTHKLIGDLPVNDDINDGNNDSNMTNEELSPSAVQLKTSTSLTRANNNIYESQAGLSTDSAVNYPFTTLSMDQSQNMFTLPMTATTAAVTAAAITATTTPMRPIMTSIPHNRPTQASSMFPGQSTLINDPIAAAAAAAAAAQSYWATSSTLTSSSLTTPSANVPTASLLSNTPIGELGYLPAMSSRAIPTTNITSHPSVANKSMSINTSTHYPMATNMTYKFYNGPTMSTSATGSMALATDLDRQPLNLSDSFDNALATNPFSMVRLSKLHSATNGLVSQFVSHPVTAAATTTTNTAATNLTTSTTAMSSHDTILSSTAI